MNKLKRIIAIMLCVLMVGSVLPVMSAAANDIYEITENTKIEQGKTYSISSIKDLETLSVLTNEKNQTCAGATFILENDIVVNRECFGVSLGDGRPVTRYGTSDIGEDNRPVRFLSIRDFKGTFDGNGHMISGVYVKNSGIFNTLENAVIKDLTINNSMSEATAAYDGALGMLCNVAYYSQIKDCRIEDSFVVNSADNTGGVVGMISNTTVDGCSNVCLENEAADKISSCVYGESYVGGIVGRDDEYSYDNTVTNCLNKSFVIANAMYSGGIIGSVGDYTSLSCCANKGEITANNNYAGGIVGTAKILYYPVSRCYNTGTVVTGEDKYTGGIFGRLYVCRDTREIAVSQYCELRELVGDLQTCLSPEDELIYKANIERYNRLKNEIFQSEYLIEYCYSAGYTRGDGNGFGTMCGELVGSAFGFFECFSAMSDETVDFCGDHFDGSGVIAGLGRDLYDTNNVTEFVGLKQLKREEMKKNSFVNRLSGEHTFVNDPDGTENDGFPILRSLHTEHDWDSFTKNEDGTRMAHCSRLNCDATCVFPALDDGDLVEFGSYPQSLVTDTTLRDTLDEIEKTWVSYDYYVPDGKYSDNNLKNRTKVSDFMKYADFSYDGERYRAVTFTDYRLKQPTYNNSASNIVQENNHYFKDTVYYFRYDPIVWQVIDSEHFVVMCRSAIDAQPYVEKAYQSADGKTYSDPDYQHPASDYVYSSIRTWLNDDFYNLAFTASEKARIGTTEINANSDSEYADLSIQTVSDKIYILSKAEALGVNTCLKSDSDRKLGGTDYAKCQGLEFVCDENDVNNVLKHYSSCMTRTVSSAEELYNIRPNGKCTAGDGDFSKYNTSVGVVPVLKFNRVSDVPMNIEKCTDHVAGKWVVLVKVGCENYGENYKYCTKCGVMMVHSSPSPLGHGKKLVETHTGNGCQDPGYKKYYCSRCDTYSYEYDEVKHSYNVRVVAPTCIEKGYTLHECKVCGASYKTDYKPMLTYHTYVPDEIYVEPTCELDGEGYLVCSMCGDRKYGVIEHLGHDDIIERIPATCTEPAYCVATCRRCGDVCKDEVDPPLGHDCYEETIRAATCYAEGEKLLTCKVCGETQTAPIPRTEHDFTVKDIVAPTCTEDGYTLAECRNCHDTLKTDPVKATGHDYEDELVKSPTCFEEGELRSVCKNCGDAHSTTVPKVEHAYELYETVQPNCNEEGCSIEKCIYCGDEIHTPIPRTTHNYVTKVKYKATCQAEGYTKLVCTICGDVQKKDIVPKTEHSFVVSGTVAPDCCHDGYTSYTCSVCGDSKTDVIPSNGHSFDEWQVDVPATTLADGVESRVCTACGEKETRAIGMLDGMTLAIPSEIGMNYKETSRVDYSLTNPNGSGYTVKWGSSDPETVSVSNDGEIHALKKGTATITCTVTDSYGKTVKATCNVTVKYTFTQWLIKIFLFGWIWY